MSPEQVEKRKKKNPDDIHEMPVEPDNLYRRVIFDREAAVRSFDNQIGQKPEADHHVQSVEGRHGVVKGEEKRRLIRLRSVILKIPAGQEMFFKMGRVFSSFETEKNRAEDHRESDEHDQAAPQAQLRGVDGEGH